MTVKSTLFKDKIGLNLLIFLVVITLTVCCVSAKCSGKSCGHDNSDALARYNRFVQAISNHRRSTVSRRNAEHVKRNNKKRSTYTASSSSSYRQTSSLRFNNHGRRVLSSSGSRAKAVYTAVQQYSAEEGRKYAMRLHQLRLTHLRKQLERQTQKPWWGQWSTWSACGRTCGCGVQFQERHCLGSRNAATHHNGKAICEGPTKKYRICNSAPCPTQNPTFRKLQCSQYAAKKIRGKFYTWKPYGHPVEEIVSNEPCQLVCVSNVNEIQLNTVAMDGTECRRGWNDGRCVEGKCQLIGCDGKINSEKLKNKCGKCEGNETSSCVIHDRLFAKNLPTSGEYEVVRVPRGAYDILINERRKTAASLVVRDMNGTILLNGGGKSDSGLGTEGWPSNLVMAGAEFRYRKPTSRTSSAGFEYLLSTGPLERDIMVYLHATVPGNTFLHYEFKTPIFETGDVVTTSMEQDGSNVDPENPPTEPTPSLTSQTPIIMPPITKPPLQISTSPQIVLLPPRPREEGIGKVSKITDYEFVEEEEIQHPVAEDDGEGFLLIRELDVSHVNGGENTERQHNSSDSQNDYGENNLIFTKPRFKLSEMEDALYDADPSLNILPNKIVRLENKNESETISRVYTVIRQLPTDNETIVDEGEEGDEDVPGGEDDGDDEDDEYYNQDYKIIPEANIPIPVRYGSRHSSTRFGSRVSTEFGWRTNGFAPCSSTCRSGLQQSYAVCERMRDHLTVDDSYCDPTTRPEPVKKECIGKPCDPRWEATPWSECSLSCGTGVQMRTVRCWQMIGSGFDSTLYTEICKDVAGEKPVETKPCKVLDQCGPLWETSDWSPCPAPCGMVGVKWRTIRCSAGQDRFCSSAPKPNSQEQCMGPRCLLHWTTTDWGPCSGVCGGGRKTRKVICTDGAGRGHPEDQCDLNTKPPTSHPCGDVNCRPEWITQDWEECSVECGSGVRHRKVMCSGIVNGEVHNYEDDTPCIATTKPPVEESCQKPDCDPVWFTTSWSKCSVTCGDGNRVREVKCYLKSAPATGCDQTQKPPQQEACGMSPCPAPRPQAECTNGPVNCALVVQVRLCSHWYYRKACCKACQNRRPTKSCTTCRGK
uniref:ADAMTS-like protein 2 n=1 Tax=Styela clava TaxID=7725 RepID=UPI00193A587D|nr:ADAMTS-like protein 2 [Styela clava]